VFLPARPNLLSNAEEIQVGNLRAGFAFGSYRQEYRIKPLHGTCCVFGHYSVSDAAFDFGFGDAAGDRPGITSHGFSFTE